MGVHHVQPVMCQDLCDDVVDDDGQPPLNVNQHLSQFAADVVNGTVQFSYLHPNILALTVDCRHRCRHLNYTIPSCPSSFSVYDLLRVDFETKFLPDAQTAATLGPVPIYDEL